MRFDVAVIGSGPGGYVAAIRAAQLGLKTICIEKDKALGGTCLNVGCIPSKALLQSSEHYAFLKNSAKEHGIESQKTTLNFKQMMKRKSEIIKGLGDGVGLLFKSHGVTHKQGTATLKTPTTLTVSNETIEADNIILATGSEPVEIPTMPFDEKTIVSSTGALGLSQVPKKLVVVGAGVIGVELASVYQRLGSTVVLVEMLDHICPGMDKAISKGLQKVLEAQGMTFHLSAKVERFKKGKVTTSVGTFPANAVLVAVGRCPYTKELGLENVNLQPNEQGQIPVDNHFRTSHPNIYAIGDLIDGPMLAHKASDEGIAVAEIIAGRNSTVNYMSIPNVIYTHPEAASAGLTEEEAKKFGLKIVSGTSHFSVNPRARVAGDTDGFVKVIAEASTHRLLGFHILGPQASELIGECVIALEMGATLKDIAYASHAHPTLSETIKEAAISALF